MSRLPVTSPESLSEGQREQYQRISRFRSPRANGELGGPFDPWVRSPELAQRAVSFGGFIWERTSLDRRIIELAILITARFWEANVEWVSHAPVALQHGVSQETIDAVFDRRRPANAPADEVLAYDVCASLHERHQLPLAIYDQTVSQFGEQGLVELIATIGYYTLVSMTLNAFEVQPDGAEPPFPREDGR
jgi:4-carboxymuconolactone decarboxylase